MHGAASSGVRLQSASRTTVAPKNHLAPSAIHGLEVLSLPVTALDTYISKAVEQNPLLELDYATSDLSFGELSLRDDDQPENDLNYDSANWYSGHGDIEHNRAEVPGRANGYRDDGLAAGEGSRSGDWDSQKEFASEPRSDSRAAREDSFDASLVNAPFHDRAQARGFGLDLDARRLRDDCCQTETLASFLRMQVDGGNLPAASYELVLSVIDCLDDNGYFAGSLHRLAHEAQVPLDDAAAALAVVQALQPRGVGARDLAECLALQLVGDDDVTVLARRIVTESLQDLADNRTTQLMRTYRISLDELGEVRRLICDLNPRPGSSFSQSRDTVYVIPDISVARTPAGFSVRVLGELAERVVLSKDYAQLAQDAKDDSGASEWLSSHAEDAKRVLANIEQRSQTLFRFGTYLVEAQFAFFAEGERALRPLTMQQAADALGFNVSTISRIVADKHVLTPWGTYPLRFFFTSGISSSSRPGAAVSSVAVKTRIRDLVAQEDPRKPLSDAAITDLLNNEGVDIKRRTVAKYREALGIGRQSQRRR